MTWSKTTWNRRQKLASNVYYFYCCVSDNNQKEKQRSVGTLPDESTASLCVWKSASTNRDAAVNHIFWKRSGSDWWNCFVFQTCDIGNQHRAVFVGNQQDFIDQVAHTANIDRSESTNFRLWNACVAVKNTAVTRDTRCMIIIIFVL